MVSIRTLAASAVTLMALPFCAAQLSASDIVTNVNLLTSKSQALQAPAQSINIVNGPLIVVGLGPFPVCTAAQLNIAVANQPTP
jgi:hypothetical protein